MMKFLRNKTNQKRIFIFLALAIIPAFLFWGVTLSSGDKGGKVPSTLGLIDNKKVSLKDYLDSYKAVQHEIFFKYGEEARNIGPLINIKGEAWDRLLLLYYAKKEKISTSDAEVVQWITRQPLFLNHGKFDDSFYRRYATEYLRMDTRSFEEEIRQLLTLDKVREKIKSKISFTDDELRALYNQENGERDIAYGVISWEAEKEKIQVTEQDLEKIYPMVKNQLKDPEKVKISYLFVPQENSQTLAAIFAEKGASLEDLSKKYDLPVKTTAFFHQNETIPEIGLYKDILAVSFSLPPAKESDWVRVDKGSYKIRVVEKAEERLLSFDEVKEDLKRLLVKQKATGLAIKRLDELKLKMVNPSDFEPVLTKDGIEVKHVEKFTKNSYLPTIGPSGPAEDIIAGLKESEISSGFPVSTGGALLKVVKDWPANDKNFAEAKEKFREKTMEKKFSESMQALLESLRSKLNIDLETMKKIFETEEKT